ncbi:hypothetical protein BH11PLA1_BH11PLA1_03890 [soil metagenome]
MNFQRKSEREYIMRLPLVALVDVVLFLLLYFLVAGTLASPESNLSAALSAERAGGGRGSLLSAQILRVEPDGKGATKFIIGGRTVADRTSLRAVLAGLPKEPGIVVRVADDADVAAAATALQVAKDVGFNKVSYVAPN